MGIRTFKEEKKKKRNKAAKCRLSKSRDRMNIEAEETGQ